MKSILTLIIGLSAVVAITAQTPRFRSMVAVVRVDALVTDGKQPVSGLTAANFELRDNGIAQRILNVSYETLPLNVLCVLDVSASVAGRPLLQLKDAGFAVIEALRTDDRAALVTFSNRLQLHSRLTADRDRLRAALRAVQAGGATSLFDGIFAALTLREAGEGRTLLLLFSDGEDTSSWLSAATVIDVARRTDVVIYPITTRGPIASVPPLTELGVVGVRSQPAAEYVLGELADDTGGRVVPVESERSLRETFLHALNEFRQRYVISYEPTDVPAAGWHTIDVKLRGRSGQIKARRGYSVAQ
jgi:VWFA-related protein